MEKFEDTFTAELRALRPAPDPTFAAALDERAAAGFPRRPERDGESPLAGLRRWFAAAAPRRVLVPGGAAALVVVVAVAVVVSQSGSSQPSLRQIPQVESFAAQNDESSAGTAAKAAPVLPSARNRDIERSASVVLGTTPDKLPEASSQVYEAVHTARGVVLSSQVHSSKQGGEARFELLIPSGRLNGALATFSGIAEVRSRHDTTADITAPTVSASEELQDSNARIASLIGQLGEAGTETQREAVEGELRGERSRHAGLRASLDRLEERASMSRVSLRIVSGHGAGISPGGDSGSWGAGDALGDAGRILAVAGGVAIIGLAIVGPIALIGLGIWLLNRFRVSRLRQRTLG